MVVLLGPQINDFDWKRGVERGIRFGREGGCNWEQKFSEHYNDVIMTTMASQITSLTVVYSTVYSDANQRKHQSSTSLAFVWGIHRDRWIPRTKGQLRGKCFHLMTSSWYANPSALYLPQSSRIHFLSKPSSGGVLRVRVFKQIDIFFSNFATFTLTYVPMLGILKCDF